MVTQQWRESGQQVQYEEDYYERRYGPGTQEIGKGAGQGDQNGKKDQDAGRRGQLEIPAVHEKPDHDQEDKSREDRQYRGNMMPVEDAFDKALAVMRHVPCFPDGGWRIKVPFHVHEPARS